MTTAWLMALLAPGLAACGSSKPPAYASTQPVPPPAPTAPPPYASTQPVPPPVPSEPPPYASTQPVPPPMAQEAFSTSNYAKNIWLRTVCENGGKEGEWCGVLPHVEPRPAAQQ